MGRCLPLLVLPLLGCVHHVSWQVQPRATFNLPSDDGGIAVAVVSNGRECKPVADALVSAISHRDGVTVRADAPIRLEVRNCDRGQERTIEFQVDGMGLEGPTTDRRRYTVRGWSAADMAVISPSGSSVVLSGAANRTVYSPWTAEDDLDVNRSIGLVDELAGDVAENLANQLAPAPIALHRTVYTDAPPGSARDLHNQAVAAEQAGDLLAALRLARLAQVKDPARVNAEYLEALQSHAVTVGQALF